MVRTEIVQSPNLTWIDVFDPTPDRLHELAREFQLHELVVQDCLDPKHLPKVELIEGAIFVIIRVRDPEGKATASSMQGLTRKIAIFLRGTTVLTIHRARLPVVEDLSQEIRSAGATNLPEAGAIVIDLMKRSVLSFERPLDEMEVQLDGFSGPLLRDPNKITRTLVRIHALRQRLATLKRLLWHTSLTIQRFPIGPTGNLTPRYQDLRETVESLLYFADDLHEETTSLMHLELAMASQRTNEVIRVLTVFSVFFMPLTFLVGIYGMNFRHLPEVEWRWGYPFAWALMIGITLAIAFWFRKRGWLKF